MIFNCGSIVSVELVVAVAPLPSVTLKLIVYGLEALVPSAGVPVMTPVPPLMIKPDGKACSVVHTMVGAPPARPMGLVAPLEYVETSVATGSVPVVSAGAAYSVML